MSIAAMTRVATSATRYNGRTRRGVPPLSTSTQANATGRDQAVADAVEVVTRYIPTEIIAAYVAVTPLMTSPNGPRTGRWVTFYLFLILAPLLVWLFTAARARSAARPLPWHPIEWPVFELAAATISFFLWAFTLPATPFEDFSWYRPGYGTAALVIGSVLIGAAAPVFRPKP